MSVPVTDMDTLHRVQDFLYREAELLDEQRFSAWAELFADPCVYWIPVDPAVTEVWQGMSHVNDDRQLLLARTHRLDNPRVMSPEPLPRTVHAIANVRIAEVAADGTLTVKSTAVVHEYRPRGYGDDDKRAFAGRVTHRLVPHGDGFRIAFKRVDLVDSEGSYNAILVPI